MRQGTGPRYTYMLALALAASAACGDDEAIAEQSGQTWGSVAGRGGGDAGRDRDAPVRAGRSARNDAGPVAGGVAGASSHEAGGSAGTPDGPAPAGAAADAGSVDVADLSDAEIASITLTFHAGELERATLAEGSAQLSEVVSFAGRMLLASSSSEQRENALYRMLSIEPADNSISVQLRTSSVRLLEQLRASSPQDFDALYLAGLETVHENALSLIARMQNSASRPEIASELALVRADVIAHLTEVRRIQSTLPSAGGPDSTDDAGAEDAGE